MPLNLNRLNENQKAAVLHTNGPLLILAGAGSGKTSTMAYRIASLIDERHIPANSILGLSFTNKAAKELKERVVKLVSQSSGKKAARGLIITTFHSLCVRMLRANGDRLGFQKDFTIVDRNDQEDILRQVLKNIRIDERSFDVGTILFAIGQAKNRFLSGAEAEAYFLENKSLGSDYGIAAASSYGKYQDQLKALNAMDFDDLLFRAVELLENHPDVREHYNCRFRHILVDEYQDTNPAQFKILSLLTERHQNLCVVGDDDQSIYAWRGADPRHILMFTHHFPASRVITLDQNYRSTNTILEAANQVIANNKMRHPKRLWSERGQGEPIFEYVLDEDRKEAELVADEIMKRAQAPEGGQARPWKDFAILYRSNSQSRLFEETLRLHRIPYQIVGGMSFLDRKEIKDILSYWRLVVNPKDDAALRRVINWPARGIGKSSIEALGTRAFAQGTPLFDTLGDAAAVAPRAAGACAGLKQLVLQLRQRLEMTPANPVSLAEWAKTSLEMLAIKKALEEESDDPAQAARKWDNVDELASSLGQMRPEEEQVSGLLSGELTALDLLRDFLARMTLEAQSEDGEADPNRDQVTLLTLHGAKGLEYPVVFLVGMEEGFLPHQRTIEEATDFGEERRLAYVGITRAKDYLILTRCKHRIRYGKPVPRNPSRFIEEIPKNLIIRKDESGTPDLSSVEARKEHETKVKGFLAEIRARITT